MQDFMLKAVQALKPRLTCHALKNQPACKALLPVCQLHTLPCGLWCSTLQTMQASAWAVWQLPDILVTLSVTRALHCRLLPPEIFLTALANTVHGMHASSKLVRRVGQLVTLGSMHHDSTD